MILIICGKNANIGIAFTVFNSFDEIKICVRYQRLYVYPPLSAYKIFGAKWCQVIHFSFGH